MGLQSSIEESELVKTDTMVVTIYALQSSIEESELIVDLTDGPFYPGYNRP